MEVVVNLEGRQWEIFSLLFTDNDVLLGQSEEQLERIVKELARVSKSGLFCRCISRDDVRHTCTVCPHGVLIVFHVVTAPVLVTRQGTVFFHVVATA